MLYANQGSGSLILNTLCTRAGCPPRACPTCAKAANRAVTSSTHHPPGKDARSDPSRRGRVQGQEQDLQRSEAATLGQMCVEWLFDGAWISFLPLQVVHVMPQPL